MAIRTCHNNVIITKATQVMLCYDILKTKYLLTRKKINESCWDATLTATDTDFSDLLSVA